MPFNLLLLPLLGGYIFISKCNFTLFDSKRHSGQRLIIESALWGLLFLVISHLTAKFLVLAFPSFQLWWKWLVPFNHSGVAFGAFLIGACSWPIANLFSTRREEQRKAINKWNDYLEIVLDQALEETRQIMVTLKNGKVYIGFVLQPFNPEFDRKYIFILPTVSGYRDKDTHVLELTTQYTSVYNQLIQEENERLVTGVDDFRILMPITEIISAHLFDSQAYEKFNSAPQEVAGD